MIFNPVVPMPKKIETIQARDIAVGSSVYLNKDGNYVEYLVVNQGIPSNSSLYDGSCNGTWLLRKDVHSSRIWDESNVNVYETSTINTWLNGDFFNSLGTVEQATIKQVKIPYRKNGGAGGTDQSGANGLSCKIFLLSGYEVGWTTSGSSSFPVDGAKLDYFESGTGTSANNKRIAYLNGSATSWWLRSPYINDSTDYANYVWLVSSGGRNYFTTADHWESIRPALILPFNAEFDKTNMRLVGIGNAQISDYAEGSTIKINENGTPVEFYIAKHNYEPELNGTGRTLVVRKDVYDSRQWKDRDINAYAGSDINDWLNSTYKNLLDANTQSLIGTTKFYYTVGYDDQTVSTLERAVFLLSITELGVTRTDLGSTIGNKEGSKLDIASNLQVARTFDGSATTQWTRSPNNTNTRDAYCVQSNGSYAESDTCTSNNGSRPCFTLPENTKVDSNGLIVT